jgi:putative PIG3 family NAD(P)H quinone oxidoreductase
MIAIEIREPGGPDVLRAVDRPIPSVGPTEVLIKVAAAGVNRPDVMQRQGRYPPPPGAPDIPGLEIAGVIEKVGESAKPWRVGDSVCALVAGGGYAEYCAAPAGLCLPLPRGIDAIHAAAIPETTFTVWANMFDRGRLTKGETILIHGGASGIGTTAIQLAHAFGATVFVTAGTDEKCRACEALGADRAFNYHEADFVAASREASEGRGVDVVLDIVGGDYFQRNLEVLAMDGRLLLIGQLGGAKAQINTTPMFRKRLTISASVLRARPVAEKESIARAVHKHIWPLLESGEVRVPVHATFPLRAAADAHRMMEESRHFGKLVLVA